MGKKGQGKSSHNQGPPEVSTQGILLLVVTGVVVLAAYIFLAPKFTVTTKGPKSESIPRMIEFESLQWQSSDGSTRTVSVLDECVTSNKAKDFQRVLGVPDSRVHPSIRRSEAMFCRAVLQQWCNELSSSPSAFPVNWITLMSKLKEIGLRELASTLNTALTSTGV